MDGPRSGLPEKSNFEKETTTMKKPMIGITPLYDDRLMSYWMIPGYMKGVQACGGIPVILPLTNKEEDMDEIMSRLDGFLITGGPDIDPRLY